MAVVTALCSVGCAYPRGRRMPGFGIITLDNGTNIYVDEPNNYYDAMVEHAESLGHDCNRMRERLNIWVKTGEIPTH